MRTTPSLSFVALASPLVVTSVVAAAFHKATPRDYDPFSLDPGFPAQKVIDLAVNISSHSWEFGTATEALLEVYNPELSIFGSDPFAAAKTISPDALPTGLSYAASMIVIGTGANALQDGDGAVGDPASLGVAAVMLGNLTGYEQYGSAATQEWEADFVYMAPPFLAYYAVATSNFTALQEAVFQCQAYHQILAYNATAPYYTFEGLWDHILGPTQNLDPNLWSTGNAWALAGITRVLATVMKAPDFPSSNATEAQDNIQWINSSKSTLVSLIKGIVDTAINATATSYDGGLIRNYYNIPTTFGETSGSAMVAATVYRLAVLLPEKFATNNYIQFAESIRKTLGGSFTYNGTTFTHIDANNGTARPAVNPLDWTDTTPFMTGSPEGQSMVAMLYAGWRDCVQASIC